MTRFESPARFRPQAQSLELLPFRFERIHANEFLVSNMVGDFLRLNNDELIRLVNCDVTPDEPLYERLYAHHLISSVGQQAQKQILALRLRSRMAYLREPTGLHIFVVTLRCEHSCPYCQVSRQSTDRSKYDMTEEMAERALDIAFQSPTKRIKIEFQGGEPLLNFALIKTMVISAKAKARLTNKDVDFVIATNLALLDDSILEFCKTNAVLLSTSLDGPAELHNKNRPRKGSNSHELAVSGIRRAQEYLGKDQIGALMTTTEGSLDCVEEIVDEYLSLDLDGIFLRPLSPYGFAIKTKAFRKYGVSRWLEFYERGLKYILGINRKGRHFPEFYSTLILKKMLSDRALGYVDLRSPAGIGLGALVYNYDGKVFASDEGRMLAEMGDRTFELGTVNDSYQSLILSEKMIDLVGSSLTQCAPMCSECAFEPHCGAEPVFHYATQNDAVGIKPLSEFCMRQKGVMQILLNILEKNTEDAIVLRRWGGL